jgi:hypothetical protein
VEIAMISAFARSDTLEAALPAVNRFLNGEDDSRKLARELRKIGWRATKEARPQADNPRSDDEMVSKLLRICSVSRPYPFGS